MRTSLIPLTLVFAFLLHGMVGMSAFAQTDPDRPKPPESLEPTLDAVTAKLKAIEDTKDLEEALKTKLLDLYRLAQTRLTDANQYAASAASYDKAIETGPTTIKSIQKELEKPVADPLKSLEIGANATSKEVQGVLAKEQASLAATKAKVIEIDKQLQQQQGRPSEVKQLITDAKQKLTDIETDLKAPPPAGESPMLTEARRMTLQSRKIARANEVTMLEKELLSQDIRLQLLAADRNVATREQTQIEARIKAAELLLQEKLVAEVGQARLDAERILAGNYGQVPAVREIAERVIEVGNQSSTLEPEIASTKRAGETLTNQLARIGTDFDSAKKKIELVGLTEALSELLRDQRRNLPVSRTSRKSSADQSQRINDIRLELLRIDDELKSLADHDKKFNDVLAVMNLPENEHPRAEKVIRSLLKHEQDVQSKLADAYRRYLSELDDVQRKQSQLEEKVDEFASFLDDRLLWIRSSPAVSGRTLANLPASAAWLFSPSNLADAASTTLEDAQRSPVGAALIMLAVLALVLARRRLFIRLDVFGGRVGLPYADRFSLTAKALLITILLALPLPMLLGFIGWRYQQATNGSEFVNAAGVVLPMVAWLYLTMKFVHLLCRAKGTAVVHFHWDTTAVGSFRRQLRWLIPTMAVFAFIIAMMEQQSNSNYRDSLGRTAFVCQMIAITCFAYMILHPRKGIPKNLIIAHPESWTAHLRYIWYPLSVLAPISMIILALTGFYYTAMQLSERLATMVWMIVAATVLHAVIVRWLVTAQQRMATERMRRERDAAEKAATTAAAKSPSDGGGPAGIASVANVNDNSIDVETIEKQTRRIVRTMIGWSLVLGTWLIWSDVLPALTLLDNFKLWDYAVVSDGQEKLLPITLTHLALAMVLLVIAFAAARNIPGVLEIALLRHLPFDAGSRYAIATIGQYIIAGIGIVAAFVTIGIGWSSIQWLVAALGVGLGFGLQEIFANFMSGIILLFERPIRVGDVVTIGDVTGVVSRIRIRATTITNWERKELIVPNKEFITGRLLNWTLSDTVNRIQVLVGVAYGTDTKRARDLLLQVAAEHPLVLEEPPSVATFDGFGDSSLNMNLRVYIPTLEGRLQTIDELHRAIDETFKAAGIEIAFPQRDIHVRSHVGTEAKKDAKQDSDRNADKDSERAKAADDGALGF